MNETLKNHPSANENDIRIKDNNYNQITKRVQGFESVINEMRHHIEEMDKRSSEQNRKVQN